MTKYSMSILVLTWPMILVCGPAQAGNPPASAKVVNLGKVNTDADENDPFLTVDGRRLLYVSNKKGTYDLLVSARANITGAWPKGIYIDNYNSKDADERSPFFTRNADLYFASDRIPDPKFKDLKNFDIFQRQGQRAPFQLRLINTKEDELHPWITPRATEFYCSRKTKDGWRVVFAKGPARGGPGEGKVIETIPAGFYHPTLTPDGLTMYLQGPVAKDRTGIFRSTRPRVGSAWTKPKPVVNLNSDKAKRGDMSPSLSPSGRYLYFASDRPEGQGGLDLWKVKTADLKVQE